MFKELINNKKFSIIFYDSYFENNSTDLKQTKNLSSAIKQSDIVLFNYATKKDLRIIKNKLIKDNIKYLVNISFKQKMFLNNRKNVINFFSNERLPIC